MWLGDRWIPHNKASPKQPTLPSCAALCILVYSLDNHTLNMDTQQLLHYVRRSSLCLLCCRRRLRVNSRLENRARPAKQKSWSANLRSVDVCLLSPATARYRPARLVNSLTQAAAFTSTAEYYNIDMYLLLVYSIAMLLAYMYMLEATGRSFRDQHHLRQCLQPVSMSPIPSCFTSSQATSNLLFINAHRST